MANLTEGLDQSEQILVRAESADVKDELGSRGNRISPETRLGPGVAGRRAEDLVRAFTDHSKPVGGQLEPGLEIAPGGL